MTDSSMDQAWDDPNLLITEEIALRENADSPVRLDTRSYSEMIDDRLQSFHDSSGALRVQAGQVAEGQRLLTRDMRGPDSDAIQHFIQEAVAKNPAALEPGEYLRGRLYFSWLDRFALPPEERAKADKFTPWFDEWTLSLEAFRALANSGVLDKQHLRTEEWVLVQCILDHLRDAMIRAAYTLEVADIFSIEKPELNISTELMSLAEEKMAAAIRMFYAFLMNKNDFRDANLMLENNETIQMAVSANRDFMAGIREMDDPLEQLRHALSLRENITSKYGRRWQYAAIIDFPQAAMEMGLATQSVYAIIDGRPLAQQVIHLRFSHLQAMRARLPQDKKAHVISRIPDGVLDHEQWLTHLVGSHQRAGLAGLSGQSVLLLDNNASTFLSLCDARRALQEQFGVGVVDASVAEIDYPELAAMSLGKKHIDGHKVLDPDWRSILTLPPVAEHQPNYDISCALLLRRAQLAGYVFDPGNNTQVNYALGR